MLLSKYQSIKFKNYYLLKFDESFVFFSKWSDFQTNNERIKFQVKPTNLIKQNSYVIVAVRF